MPLPYNIVQYFIWQVTSPVMMQYCDMVDNMMRTYDTQKNENFIPHEKRLSHGLETAIIEWYVKISLFHIQ